MWNGLKAGCAPFDGDGQLAIDELWNENQLAPGTPAKPVPMRCHRRMTGAKGTGGCHSGKAAGTGNTACLVER